MNENSNCAESVCGSFASEFEKYLSNGRLDEFKVGNIVKGTVTSVDKEAVSVDIGASAGVAFTATGATGCAGT